MPHPIYNKLKAIPLFLDFSDQEIDQFISLTDPTLFRAGDFVMRQGHPGDCMYYVAEGHCRAMDKRGDRVFPLAEFGPGSIFGELALFDQQPRSADVLAITDCVLLKCTDGALHALAGIYPGAAFKFVMGTVREVGDRLRKANKRYVDVLVGEA